jgi:hypothetical protein
VKETILMSVEPPGAGKTTALLMLYYTLVDYANNLGVKAYCFTPDSPCDLHMKAIDLVRYGKPPPPNLPQEKDIKLEIEFNGLIFPKKVGIAVADIAGTITGTLTRIWSNLGEMTPVEIQETLKERGLSEKDIQ